jgi:hypothetical protein
VTLTSEGNNFVGGLEVISGTAKSAWSDNSSQNVSRSMQSRVQIKAADLKVAGAGLEADVISLQADSLATAAGSVIVARLPYDPLQGPEGNLPALTLTTTAAARDSAAGGGRPYGAGGGGEIAVNVGNNAWATSSRSGPNSGFVSVLSPPGGSNGALAVVLSGPAVGANAYTFFALGSGQEGSIPVFYNGVGTLTPTQAISVGTTVSVAESARKERFDDAVRTENVAVRLRQGVIAEVGPGRPATQGSEGLRPPLVCTPAALAMSCSNDVRP